MESAVNESCALTPTEKKNLNRYCFELIGALLFYGALLVASVKTVGHADGIAKYAIAIMPALGGVAIVVAVVRALLRMDEFQRRTFVNAAAITALITVIGTLTIGFLENAGVPRPSMINIFPIAFILWGAVYLVLRRRNA